MAPRQRDKPQLAPPPPDPAGRAQGAIANEAAPEVDASKSNPELVARQRSPARGAPAHLTQSEVDALVRRQVDRTVAERLASGPLDFESATARSAATFAPVTLEAEDLALLEAEGRVSVKFEQRIERTAFTRRQSGESGRVTSRGKSKPTLPPGEVIEPNGR